MSVVLTVDAAAVAVSLSARHIARRASRLNEVTSRGVAELSEATDSHSSAPKDPLAAALPKRGVDWSDFDGRSLRDQLDDWQVILLAELRGEDVTQAAAGFLSAWGVCPGGHWTQHCYEGCQP